MIWSIIPPELVFGSEVRENVREVEYAGRTLLLRENRVEALTSTDPLDYLDPRFQPGADFTAR